MPNIIYDARMASHPGIGRYIRSLLEAMLEATKDSTWQWTLIGHNLDLQNYLDHKHVSLRECRIPIYSLQEQLCMRSFYQGGNVVHVPHFNVPVYNPPPHLIVTIHDLIYLRCEPYHKFPGQAYVLKKWIERVARKAEQVIVVSEATQKDCWDYYPFLKNKTHVIHEACHPSFLASSNPSREILPDPYILYVGSMRYHKNTHGLIQVFLDLKKELPNPIHLVIAGKLDTRYIKSYPILQHIQQDSHIRWVPNASDAQLKSYYKNAQALILPSFYEGFGLPLLEAMGTGCPILTSNRSSMPEIAQDAAHYFDPDSVDSMKRVIYNLLTNPAQRKALKENGRRRLQAFSWTKAAQKTLALYEQMVKSPNETPA